MCHVIVILLGILNSFFESMNSRRGFTLIELLVVISIIMLLSTIAINSYGDTRARSRDVRRASDILTSFYNFKFLT